MNKKIIINILLVGAIAVGGYFIFNSGKKAEPPVTVAQNQEQEASQLEVEVEGEGEGLQIEEIKLFDMAQVASHKDATSCWTVIRGEVYDLTEWIAKHPGGEGAILGICGKDGTDKFVGKHGGLEKQEAALVTFKIGELR